MLRQLPDVSVLPDNVSVDCADDVNDDRRDDFNDSTDCDNNGIVSADRMFCADC